MARKLFPSAVKKHALAFSVLAAALLFSPALRAQQPDPNPIPPPSRPEPNSPNAPTAPVARSGSGPGSSPSSNMMRTWRKLTYTCDANTKVFVNLHATHARAVFNAPTPHMNQTEHSNAQNIFGHCFRAHPKG